MNRQAIGHVAAGIIRSVTQLARIDVSDRQKTTLVTEACSAIDWASLTFIGQTHHLALRLEGEAAVVADALARIEAGIAEADVPLAGHFVAEVRITETGPATVTDTGDVVQRFCIEYLLPR